jgi:hypothetical protein
VVIPAQFDAAGEFSEGLAAVEKDDKWGYIDKTGKVVIPLTFAAPNGYIRYSGRGGFREGLAAVHFGGGRWGYINKTGKVVIQPQFGGAEAFSEGLALVETGEIPRKHGYINKAGQWVIPPQFTDASPFSEGFAAVLTSVGGEWINGKRVYIDKTGKVAIPLQFEGFERIWSFRDGLAKVETLGKGCYIDKNGRYIWDPTH